MKPGIARRLTVEAAAILVAAGALGLAFNALSPRGIAITRPLTLRELDERYLTAEETRARFDAGQTIFLDVRRAKLFGGGHIAGALNLPAEEFTKRFAEFAPMLPRETEIVIYCDSRRCELSRQVADLLTQLGYRSLKIFYHGWDEWSQHGWPTEK
ncbi:MAG: rhodanese-like domain-containing protein [Verrucomicrobia bacterium]|nr:rhodanese-like domain-containing protein [Verrucomicrobiota bacterium]